MPELPDLTVYVEALERHVGGAVLDAKGLEKKLVQERSEHLEGRRLTPVGERRQVRPGLGRDGRHPFARRHP